MDYIHEVKLKLLLAFLVYPKLLPLYSLHRAANRLLGNWCFHDHWAVGVPEIIKRKKKKKKKVTSPRSLKNKKEYNDLQKYFRSICYCLFQPVCLFLVGLGTCLR